MIYGTAKIAVRQNAIFMMFTKPQLMFFEAIRQENIAINAPVSGIWKSGLET
ncbi:MAG: hypothetical protein UHO63_06810 [Blautia sp.]|nr:hypothetical protein [Blautia sp.]